MQTPSMDNIPSPFSSITSPSTTESRISSPTAKQAEKTELRSVNTDTMTHQVKFHPRPAATVSRSAIPLPTTRPAPIPLRAIMGEVLTIKAKELKAAIGPMNYARLKIDQQMAAVFKAYDSGSKTASSDFCDFQAKMELLKESHTAGTKALTAPRPPPKHVANGAIKQVWGRSDVPTKVFYTALKGSSSAEKELKSEAATMQTIQKNLKKNVLTSFIDKELKPLGLKSSTMRYMSKFNSVQDLKKEIENPKAHEKISPEDLKKLREFLTSDRGVATANKAISRGAHLAVDLKIAEGAEKIGGHYTLEVDRADGDLEKLLKNPSWYTPADLVDIMSQVVDGMADLHAAGYVHGDLKPENVLVTWKDGKWEAKISDFGKTKAMNAKESARHVGNTLFAPWENRLSMKGDVCSTGIKLIRILEQHVLAAKRKSEPGKRSLIEPARVGAFKAASSEKHKREGIEVFVIESKDFNAIEAYHTKGQKIIGRIIQGKNMLFATSQDKLRRIGSEKDRYIDALAQGLKDTKFGDSAAIDNLCKLLKEMTSTNVEERLTMEEAQNRLAAMRENLPMHQPATRRG